jgi:hypothetical protein
MKNIKEMIETATSKSMAINTLNQWRLFGTINEMQYQNARKLITKEFKK